MTALEDMSFDLNNEIPIIQLPCFCNPLIYHYGSESGYQRFRHSYFIKNICESNENIIYKHIITDVTYKPDNNYSITDGHFGKCWIVTINNNENDKIEKFYIRNWIDIVEYYKEKGNQFVEEILK